MSSNQLWLNKPEDIDVVIDRMLVAILETGTPCPTLNEIFAFVAAKRECIVDYNQVYAKPVWHDIFRDLGTAVLEFAIVHRLFDQPKFTAMLLQKHKAYGLTALTAWGELGILMRIDSKVNRAINIANHRDIAESAARSDESFADTVVDIIGYCVLGMYMANGGKLEQSANGQ